VGVPLKEFVAGHTIEFAIFVRLGASKFVKVASHGEDMAEGMVARLASKGVTHLFLTREDFRAYVGLGLDLVQAVGRSKALPNAKKAGVLAVVTGSILSSINAEGVNPETMKDCKALVSSSVQLLANNEVALALLESLNAMNDWLYAHSLGVSTYGVMLAKKLGWTSTPSLVRIATAGLLHDIGLKGLPPELLAKSSAQMSVDELKEYSFHPLKSADLLYEMGGLTEEIIQAVLHHHEACDGSGYPKHLNARRISPLGKVLSIVDEFCMLTIKNPTTRQMNPKDAIARMQSAFASSYDATFLTEFVALVNGG